MSSNVSARPAVLVVATLLLAGCASLPADLGRRDVDQALRTRGLEPPGADAQSLTREALAAPLTLDTAIQLALLNNPELRVRTAQLGFAAADVYDAGRLSNPVLSVARMEGGGEPHAQLTLGIAVNFTELLFLRGRGRIADAGFEAAKAEVAAATLNLAADVEAAYRRSAAATQTAALQAQLAAGARAGATLAQRFFDAGNLKRASLALEQATGAEVTINAERADAEAREARAALLRLLGLREDQTGDTWSLAEPLAVPVAAEESLDSLLKLARDSRLELVAARHHADAVAARYGVARRTLWIDELEVGAERERDFDGAIHSGPTASLALPLFNWGQGRKARGAAELRSAEAELQARELDVQREIRAAWHQVDTTRRRANRYREVLIPARETVVEQLQREQNYMLIDVFTLLSARQQSGAAYAGYLDALRDYWIARAELSRALGRRLPSTNTPTDPVRLPGAGNDDAPPDAPPADHDTHQHHHHHEAQP